jgi:hypothetical protein
LRDDRAGAGGSSFGETIGIGTNSGTTQQYSRNVSELLYDIGIKYALLFQIVRNGVLGEKRRENADFGSDPFTLGVRGVGRMVAAAAATELGAKISALNLIELFDLAPSFVSDGAGNVDF